MKRLLTLFLAFGAASLDAAPRPLRVLFLGHESQHHDSGSYLPLLMQTMGREAIYFDYYTDPDKALRPEVLADFDAVMVYANHNVMKPGQYEALSQFVEGGKGFLPIHCASACFGNEPKFVAMVGGRFKSHGTGVFKATIVDKSHPVMQGVEEWETWDETYVHSDHNTEFRKLLMERVEKDSREPWTWVRSQGKGRVFYTASGHDDRTWKNPMFQKMLRNAIVWSVGDSAKAEWEAFLAQREPEKREKRDTVANYEKRPEPVTFQYPLGVKGAIERTQVPADCRLELFAAEPDIRKPIALAWDERGRCWIAETADYPHGVQPDGKGNDSIRICEDTDGDGRADKFTVFAEGLNIPTSLVFSNGGVIVAQAPRLLFLKDTDGDGKADLRQEIMTGWGIKDTHAQVSSLRYGHDNNLYGAVGYSGFDGTVGGQKLSFSQGTFRFKPDGSAMEFLHQFSNNTWGQGVNDAFDQFGGTANNAPIFFGGIPASVVPKETRIMTAKKINEVYGAHAITPNYRQVDVMGGFTAAAGSNFIYSKNLPARFQGMAMVCEPTMKLVALMDVRPNGAGYTAKDGFNIFASSDEWTSPVFADVGPDGAVWIADFQNFIIQHNPTPSVGRGGYDAKTGPGGAHENPLRDKTRGRIYRVEWKDAKPVKKDLSKANSEQLVAALGDDVLNWRLTAQRLLVDGKRADAVPALRKLALSPENPVASIHALWTLQGLGSLDADTHKAALRSPDARVRRNAIRALGTSPAFQEFFFAATPHADPDLNTRLAALIKLSTFPTSDPIKAIVRKVATDEANRKDEWLKEASKLLLKKHDALQYKEGPNLLVNADLEKTGGDGLPEGWKRRDYNREKGTTGAKWEVVSGDGKTHSGSKAFRVVTTEQADTSFFQDVKVKPNTDYRLTGWVKTKGVRGFSTFNVHGHDAYADKVERTSDWTKVEAVFSSRNATILSVNILHVAQGEAIFDDLKLTEVTLEGGLEDKVTAGDANRGKEIFWNHPAMACKSCHMIGGQGSAVGPALDGIASRQTEAYLKEALLEPNAKMAKGFENLPISPMPPMGAILKPQELADILAFLQTLK